MKGVILAGGTGSRLYPLTKNINKHLLPVYNKPMIYYPLSVLMLSKIREVLIISTTDGIKNLKKLLHNGKDLGLKISYKIQQKPRGIVDGIKSAGNFIKNQNFCLILGDNIFYGENFSKILKKYSKLRRGATIFGYPVNNPENFGVINFYKNNISSLEEKPKRPKSNYAVTGLYFFDQNAYNFCKKIKKSKRNEYEIIDLLNIYLKNKELKYELFGRGFAWLDAGSFENLSLANQYIESIENRQLFKIGCLEEISYKNEWISRSQFKNIIQKLPNNDYKEYLQRIIFS